MTMPDPITIDPAPFTALLGPKRVVTALQPERLRGYGVDATGYSDAQFTGCPALAVLPETTAEVASIAKICHDHDIPLTVSGGRTGLAAAATATAGQVVMAMERMNAIETIDTVGGTATVQAGVVTQTLQEAAAAKGLHFAVDLAAKGSCQIGGNIATNAGGLAFIRYGGMAEQVLGLEVVLADGTVLPMDRSLVKDNSGYNLKALFIGSEGTLGIITKAVVKLWPAPPPTALALFGVSDFSAVPKLLARSRSQDIAAFEFFDAGSLAKLMTAQPDIAQPLAQPQPYYVLAEFAAGKAPEQLFAPLLEVRGVEDAVLATNAREYQQLWRYRERLSEAIQLTGHVKKNDIAVAIKDLAACTDALAQLAGPAGVEVLLFGHIGDGNIHINYWGDRAALTAAQFAAATAPLERQVEKLILSFDGSMSAEHGIGLLKKTSLVTTRSEAELMTMKAIKGTLDPSGILNPGKVL